MSREMTAPRLLKGIREGRIQKDELNQHERRICVQYLTLETNKSPYEIAEDLGVTYWTVHRDQKYLEEIQYKLQEPLETERVVRHFLWRARLIQAKALRNDDLKLVWEIERDVLDRLGKIGVIPYKNELLNVHMIGKQEMSFKTSDLSSLSEEELAQRMDRAIEKAKEYRELVSAKGNDGNNS